MEMKDAVAIAKKGRQIQSDLFDLERMLDKGSIDRARVMLMRIDLGQVEKNIMETFDNE